MIGVILAAGIASRLRPLTNSVPKPLLPVGGTPLLERTLRALYSHDVRHAVIVTGYFREMVEQFVHSLDLRISATFLYNEHFESTNNNYSLWCAGKVVAGHEMILLDADILFDPRILGRLLAAPQDNALIIRAGTPLGAEEVKVQCDPNGRVLKIGKDIDPLCACGESLGIEKFSAATTPALFASLGRRKDRNEFYETSFQEIIQRGTDLFTVDNGGYPCMEIDTVEDLRTADELARTMSL